MGLWVYGFMGSWVLGFLGSWLLGFLGSWPDPPSPNPAANRAGWLPVVGLSVLAASAVSAAGKGDINDFLGTWRGTSTCVNRQIAPACKDETVVYEVQPSDKPKTAVLKADKIVNGQRVPMGDLEFTYSEEEGCWRSEFTAPRFHGVWCLTVEGDAMTGNLRDAPGNAKIRKVELKRE